MILLLLESFSADGAFEGIAINSADLGSYADQIVLMSPEMCSAVYPVGTSRVFSVGREEDQLAFVTGWPTRA